MSSKLEAVVLAQSECTSLTNFMMVVYTSMIVLASVIGIYGGCIQIYSINKWYLQPAFDTYCIHTNYNVPQL